VADVVKAILFCNSQVGLQCCLRAGGHSVAGYSVLNDRVVIDVSNIKGVFVDQDSMTATAGAGVTWSEYNYELDAYGFHNPGGSCSTVGITGYTLGGGYGYTSMRWGMACDNLVEITVVTAAGTIVTANSSANSDLFWACQGGTGGNFGVVVSLTYKVYAMQMVWPIQVNWPIGDAAALLYTWQNDMTKTLADTSLGMLGFLASAEVPGTTNSNQPCMVNQPYFAIRGIYSGDSATDGAAALQPLLNIGTPTYPAGPLWQTQVPYEQVNEHLLDNVEGVIPDNYKETKRSAYINNPLTQAQYQQIVSYFCLTPSVFNICSMEPYGGAINAVADNATAFVHRNAYFNIFTDAFWLKEADMQPGFDWLYGFYESESMQGLWSQNYYQNYPNSAYPNWQNGYFGTNYAQLQQVKLKWDPSNVFNFEQSIELPATHQ
jgi:FAD/FMN-containing dehydrogenase